MMKYMIPLVLFIIYCKSSTQQGIHVEDMCGKTPLIVEKPPGKLEDVSGYIYLGRNNTTTIKGSCNTTFVFTNVFTVSLERIHVPCSDILIVKGVVLEKNTSKIGTLFRSTKGFCDKEVSGESNSKAYQNITTAGKSLTFEYTRGPSNNTIRMFAWRYYTGVKDSPLSSTTTDKTAETDTTSIGSTPSRASNMYKNKVASLTTVTTFIVLILAY